VSEQHVRWSVSGLTSHSDSLPTRSFPFQLAGTPNEGSQPPWWCLESNPHCLLLPFPCCNCRRPGHQSQCTSLPAHPTAQWQYSHRFASFHLYYFCLTFRYRLNHFTWLEFHFHFTSLRQFHFPTQKWLQVTFVWISEIVKVTLLTTTCNREWHR